MAKQKNGFPTPYTILFLLTILMGVLTYIVPTGMYDYTTQTTHQLIKAQDVASYTGDERLLPVPGSYQSMPPRHIGISDILFAPVEGIADGLDIIIFVLCIGAFITTTMKTGALDAAFTRVIKKYEGRERMMIPILMFLFSLGGTAFGMAEETIAFYPLLIPIMIRAHLDTYVAVSVVFIGSVMGLLGAFINPFSVGIASGFAGVSIGDGIVLRVLMFITANIVAIWFVMKYAAKIEKDPSASITYDIKDELEERYLGASKDETSLPEFTGQRKLIMLVFTITFIALIWGVLPWDRFGLPHLLLGWWFKELAVLFLVSTVIIGIIGKMNEKEIIACITKGASDFIPIGLVIGVARGVTIIMKKGMLQDTILHFAETSVVGHSNPIILALIIFLVFIPLAFFITSSSGLATVTMPIMAPVATLAHLNPSFVVTLYVFSAGLLSLINPTDAILNAAVTMTGTSYKRYIQYVWPLFTMLLIIVLVFIVIGSISATI